MLFFVAKCYALEQAADQGEASMPSLPPNLLRTVALGLGVPGILGMGLYTAFQWVGPGTLNISPEWAGPIVFCVVLGSMVIILAYLYFHRSTPPKISGPLSISVPSPMPFQQVAKLAAAEDVVAFNGFKPDELNYLIEARIYTGKNISELLQNIGHNHQPNIRKFTVDVTNLGRITLNIK
jgi:hypothetical protein